MAEVDGNRTRRTRIARSDRVEDGGTHQACGHLRRREYPSPAATTQPSGLWPTQALRWVATIRPMKRLLLLIILIALGATAAKKLQS